MNPAIKAALERKGQLAPQPSVSTSADIAKPVLGSSSSNPAIAAAMARREGGAAPTKGSKVGMARTIFDELLTKPLVAPFAIAGKAMGLINKDTVKLPLVAEPYKIPQGFKQTAGALGESALTAAMLIPGLGEGIGAARIGAATVKGAETAAKVTEAASTVGKVAEVEAAAKTAAKIKSSAKAAQAAVDAEKAGQLSMSTSKTAEEVAAELADKAAQVKKAPKAAKIVPVEQAKLPIVAAEEGGLKKLVQESTSIGEKISPSSQNAGKAREVARNIQQVEATGQNIGSTLRPLPGEFVEPIQKSRFFKDLLKPAAIGSAYSTTQEMQRENSTAGSIAQAALIGGAIGAAFPLAGKAISSAVKPLYSDKLKQAVVSSGLYRHILGEAGNVLKHMGASGKIISKALYDVRDASERAAASAFAKFKDKWDVLTPETRIKLVDFIEGKTSSIPKPAAGESAEAISSALSRYEEQRRLFANTLKKQGFTMQRREYSLVNGKKVATGWSEVPFEERANYFPKLLDPNKVEKGGKAIVEYLYTSGQADTRGEALRIFNAMKQNSTVNKASNIEFSRSYSLPEEYYVKDPMARFHVYAQRVSRRLAEAGAFGRKNEKLFERLATLRAEAGDEAGDVAEKIVNRVLSLEKDKLPEAYKTILTANRFKLGMASLSNAFQSVNTLVSMGVRATADGLLKSFTKEGNDFARLTGAISESVVKDLSIESAESGAEKWLDKMLRYTGFNATELFNRKLAANATRSFVMRQIPNAIKGEPFALRKLAELGISLDEKFAASVRNKPIVDMHDPRLIKAAQQGVHRTQFRAQALDLPLFWTSPEGRIITQFKSFPFKMAQFVSREIIKEAAQGNFRPLARFVASASLLGEVSADVRAMARGDKSRWDEQGLERWLTNVSSVGGLGLLSDVAKASATGKQSVLQQFVGPTGGDAADILVAGAGLVKGNADPAGKFVTGHIPIVGPMLKNTIYPSK